MLVKDEYCTDFITLLLKIQYIYSQDRRRFYISYLHEICIRIKSQS